MNPLRTRLAAAVVGAGIIVALPAAAWAGPLRSSSTSPTTASSGPSDSTRPGLEALRAKCLAAIDVRLPALAAAKAARVEARNVRIASLRLLRTVALCRGLPSEDGRRRG